MQLTYDVLQIYIVLMQILQQTLRLETYALLYLYSNKSNQFTRRKIIE